MKPRHSFLAALTAFGRCRGFSLVEMMACVSIIGIIAFLAIPSITGMRQQGEENLAITRAEALNVAQATYMQAKGRTEAARLWQAAGTDQAKFELIRPYLSYPEATLSQYLPSGYQVQFPERITDMKKVSLRSPSRNILY